MSTKRDVEAKKQQKPQEPEPKPLAPVKKEIWSSFLITGDKYIDACNVTRATFGECLESLRKQDLTGFSDYENHKAFKKSHQGSSKAKMLAAKAQMLSPSP